MNELDRILLLDEIAKLSLEAKEALRSDGKNLTFNKYLKSIVFVKNTSQILFDDLKQFVGEKN
jgi:hypothetical protein